MSVVVSDELQQLFDLREHLSKCNQKLSLAEAQLKRNMQHNSEKECVDIHDLEETQKLMKPLTDAKNEYAAINEQFQRKKTLFIALLKASGCRTLGCTNKEWDVDGKFEYVPYKIYLTAAETDLLIKQEKVAMMV